LLLFLLMLLFLSRTRKVFPVRANEFHLLRFHQCELCACYRVKVFSLSPSSLIFLKTSMKGNQFGKRTTSGFPEQILNWLPGYNCGNTWNVCMVELRVASSTDKLRDWVSDWMTKGVAVTSVRLGDQLSHWLRCPSERLTDWMTEEVPGWKIKPHWLREWPTDRMTDRSSYWGT
jgi:hypothetical protein